MKTKQPDKAYSDAETVRRREAALKRMLNIPPKRHSESAPIRNKRKPQTASKKR